MPHRRSPLHKALRAASLALLLVGLVTRPVLIMAGEIHLMQHEARAAADARAHAQQHRYSVAHAHTHADADADADADDGADHGHDHGDRGHGAHGNGHTHHDDDRDHALFSSHVKGAHSLMHQSGPGASIDGVAAMPQLASLPPAPVALSAPAAVRLMRRTGAPFRPPIA